MRPKIMIMLSFIIRENIEKLFIQYSDFFSTVKSKRDNVIS